jgi:nitrate/TMAO reductase-like tetraheme cytochrome c subunit
VSARAVAGLLLLAGAAAGVFVLSRLSGDAPLPAQSPAPAGVARVPLGGPATCLPCHAQVVEEWRASMHAAAFTDPQVRAPDQTDNFTKAECIPCHAPAPLFEAGIAKDSRVLARVERRADGVDCLSCHALGGGVAASRPGLSGACGPQDRPELSSEAACAACHNQHQTHDEWRASPAAAAGTDCLDCHMPPAQRSAPEAGAPRTGASHRFLGGRDREHALSGLRVEPRVEQGELRVTLHNEFAGHNLPTDSRNRALDLVVTLHDARGAALPPPAGEPREPGCETGSARLRFRNPYRASGQPSTQIPAGTGAELRVPLPPEARRATIELFYKLQPWIPDREAHWSWRQDVEVAAP